MNTGYRGASGDYPKQGHTKTIAEDFRDAVQLARRRAFLRIQDRTRRITDEFQLGKLTQVDFRDALMNLMDEAIEVMNKQ